MLLCTHTQRRPPLPATCPYKMKIMSATANWHSYISLIWIFYYLEVAWLYYHSNLQWINPKSWITYHDQFKTSIIASHIFYSSGTYFVPVTEQLTFCGKVWSSIKTSPTLSAKGLPFNSPCLFDRRLCHVRTHTHPHTHTHTNSSLSFHIHAIQFISPLLNFTITTSLMCKALLLVLATVFLSFYVSKHV